jgi:hypothetical protein
MKGIAMNSLGKPKKIVGIEVARTFRYSIFLSLPECLHYQNACCDIGDYLACFF